MSVQKVYERIMKVLSNEEPSSVSEDYVLSLINEAQKKLAFYSNRTQTEEILLLPGDLEADLPRDILSLNAVYWKHNQDIKELRLGAGNPPLDADFQEEIDDKGEGTPKFYYTKFGKILIQPSPTVESQLYLVYAEEPPEITEIEGTSLFYGSSENFIFNQAIFQFLLDNGEEYRANQWKPRRDESLMEWIDNSQNQMYSQPIMMKMRW